MKTKNSLLVITSLFCLFLFLGACAEETEDQSEQTTESDAQEGSPEACGNGICDSVEKEKGLCSVDCGGNGNTAATTETTTAGSTGTTSSTTQIPQNGAWENDLWLATSSDGLTFTKDKLLVEHVGVPNLLLTSSGVLIATYQYFSYDDPENPDTYGLIAYSLSEDDGETWTGPVLVTITGLPEATTSGKQGEVFVTHAVDPTLVELSDGSLRLYFTYQEVDEDWPHPVSAINTDGDISGTFTYEEDSGIDSEEEAALLDPAVVYFDGLWHYYTWNVAQQGMGNDGPTTVADIDNYHGTSEDGLTFTLEDPITLDMGFLGQAVVIDGGIRFYGTGNGGIVSAFSSDGYTFEMDEGSRLQAGGGDPGVAQLDDGSFVMIYTGPSQN